MMCETKFIDRRLEEQLRNIHLRNGDKQVEVDSTRQQSIHDVEMKLLVHGMLIIFTIKI